MRAATHINSGDAAAIISRCRQLGVDQVCLGVAALPGVAASGVPDVPALRRLVEELAAAGIAAPVALASSGRDMAALLDPRSPIADDQGRILAALGAAGFEALLYYIHWAQPATQAEEDAAWRGLAAFMRRLIRHAEEAGVYLAHHPIWRCLPEAPLAEARRQGVALAGYAQFRCNGWDGPYLVASHAHLERLLDAAPSAYNGVCFCTGMHIMGADVPAMVERFRGRVHFAQLRDVRGRWPASEEVPLGEGDLAIDTILQGLADTGYGGAIGTEHYGPRREPDEDQEAMAVAFLQQRLALLSR